MTKLSGLIASHIETYTTFNLLDIRKTPAYTRQHSKARTFNRMGFNPRMQCSNGRRS